MLKILVDTNLVFCRSCYAMADLIYENENGEKFPIGGMFGILKLVQQIMENNINAQIYFMLDDYSKQRKEIFNEYKAGRETPTEISQARKLNMDLYKILSYFENINIFKVEGYEADDLIASAALNKNEEDIAIIISSDKDFYQLLTYSNVYMSKSFEKGQYVFIQEQDVIDKLGVSLKLTRFLRPFKGDSSDNIEASVKNIKTKDLEKICSKIYSYILINKCSLSEAYDFAINDIEISRNSYTKLVEGKNKYLLNFQLMDLLKYQANPINNMEKLTFDKLTEVELIEILNKYRLNDFKKFYCETFKLLYQM